MFTPNPVILPDGRTWRDRSGDAELNFCLPPDVKTRFEKILQENAEGLGMSGQIEFV